MLHSYDSWKMLAGIAFFLLAMNFMENSLRLLVGRRFKILLKKHTLNKGEAVFGGIIGTGLLQSSSVVNLLLLNLVGAGVLQMENALALLLGSNLGSTLTGWLLATIGFNYSIESFVLPLLGISGLLMAFLSPEGRCFLAIRFLFSISLLFLALGYIKSGMEGFVAQVQLENLPQYPLIIFLLLGVLFTALIQSSSATTAIVLSALHSGGINITIAMSIVLGAEIGTTVKFFLASINGAASKKRLALGNFLFNTITVTIIFISLRPINFLITELLSIKDNLIGLVFFQSFSNLVCILLFFPFLHKVGDFLMKRFSEFAEESFYINKVSMSDMDLALEALDRETRHLIYYVIAYSLHSFNLNENLAAKKIMADKFNRKSITEQYLFIKQLHGEMHGFYLRLLNEASDSVATERLDQLIAAIRNSMYAAKNIRDAQHDIEQMSNSSNDTKYDFYIESRNKLNDFYQRIQAALDSERRTNSLDDLTQIYRSITSGYSKTLESLYKDGIANKVSEIEISTMINFNRELYTSFKSILFGLKDYLLTVKEAEFFDAQPGFIR